MTPEELRDRIDNIKVWQRNKERARHKPLLLILALGLLRNEHRKRLDYASIEISLQKLLKKFGLSPRINPHPEYPFWRLQGDGIWIVVNREHYTINKSGDVSRKQLIENGAQAGFTDEILTLLNQHPTLIGELSQRILDAYFPKNMHKDILLAVNL